MELKKFVTMVEGLLLDDNEVDMVEFTSDNDLTVTLKDGSEFGIRIDSN